jgi:hypothetical protein
VLLSCVFESQTLSYCACVQKIKAFKLLVEVLLWPKILILRPRY